MTTITATIENKSYWNNIPFDQLFDIDQFLTSDLDFTPFDDDDQSYILMEEEHERTSSSSQSETDCDQSQTLSPNNSPQQTSLSNLVCGVCGAPASGYNFDQITCESCKAFFRRNALRYKPNLTCRFTGSCVIDVRTRRLCTYCRLKKCFDINMRKEWIRTDEEKELRQLQKLAKEQRRLNRLVNAQQPFLNLPIVARRKKRLMIKPTGQDLVVKSMHTKALFGFNRNLCDEDRTILNNITNAYQSIDEQVDSVRERQRIPVTSLIQFLNRENLVHQSLINFFKLVPEFNQLDIHDRVLLIKSNLVKLVHLHSVLIFHFQQQPGIGKHMTQWVGEDFHQGMSRARQSFNRFIEHPLIMKLALIVFIFSMNLSLPYSNNPFDDYSNKINIREIQDFYVTILWRYLNSLYEEREAIRSMDIIMAQILRFQTLMNEMEGAIRQKPDRDTMNELEVSLFRLTC